MEFVPSPDTLAIPPDLLAEIQAEAVKQHRRADEILRDAVKRYMTARRHDRKVFRTEDLSDAELKALTEGEMDIRHNYLNAELD